MCYLEKRAKVIARKVIGEELGKVVAFKLSLQITNEFPDVCRLLEGMPVQMYFNNNKVSFKMHFSELNYE